MREILALGKEFLWRKLRRTQLGKAAILCFPNGFHMGFWFAANMPARVYHIQSYTKGESLHALAVLLSWIHVLILKVESYYYY